MPRSRSPKSSHYKNDYHKSGGSSGRHYRDRESSYYRDSSSSHRRRQMENYEEEKKYRRRRSRSRSSSRQVYSSRHSYSRSRSRSGSNSRKARNYHSRSNSGSPSKSRIRSKHRYNRSHSRSRSPSHLSHSSRRHKSSRKTPDKNDSSKRRYSRSRSASRSPSKMDNNHHYHSKETHSSSSNIYKRNESQHFSNDENSYGISIEEREARLHAINSIKEDFENTRYSKNTLSENLTYNIYGNEDSRENGNSGSNNDDDGLEPIDKEKIHKEIEEKLRLALAKEGKVYPPPKPEASHPVFANDGSFLEVFKRMQEQASNTISKTQQSIETVKKATILNPICKRRGGKILKTGIVAKPKTENTPTISDPKDVWSLYLQEVKKYKNTSCDVDGKTRPLMK